MKTQEILEIEKREKRKLIQSFEHKIIQLKTDLNSLQEAHCEKDELLKVKSEEDQKNRLEAL